MEALQALSFLLMGLALFCYFSSSWYKAKKEKEYQNDERWKSIVARTASLVRDYYSVLLCLTILGNFFVSRSSGIYLNLRDGISFFIIFLLGANGVELAALCIYDKKM